MKLNVEIKDENGRILHREQCEKLLLSTSNGCLTPDTSDINDTLALITSMTESILCNSVSKEYNVDLEEYTFKELHKKSDDSTNSLYKSMIEFYINAIRNVMLENLNEKFNVEKDKDSLHIVVSNNGSIIKETDTDNIMLCVGKGGTIISTSKDLDNFETVDVLHQMACNSISSYLVNILSNRLDTSIDSIRNSLENGDSDVHEKLNHYLDNITECVREFHYAQKMKGKLENSDQKFIVDEEEMMKQMLDRSFKELLDKLGDSESSD